MDSQKLDILHNSILRIPYDIARWMSLTQT